jgi:hypothetical protein
MNTVATIAAKTSAGTLTPNVAQSGTMRWPTYRTLAR